MVWVSGFRVVEEGKSKKKELLSLYRFFIEGLKIDYVDILLIMNKIDYMTSPLCGQQRRGGRRRCRELRCLRRFK